MVCGIATRKTPNRWHPLYSSLVTIDIPADLAASLRQRYELKRVLGHGGMATVYLAQDLKHERKVALKVLRPELAAALGPERFLREIEIAARLQHPHILPLHDSGEADGLLYYVMPYVEGESLRQRLQRRTAAGSRRSAALSRRDVADALRTPTGRASAPRHQAREHPVLPGARRSSPISASRRRSARPAEQPDPHRVPGRHARTT